MLGVRCLTVNCLWCCVLVESWKQYNRKNRPALRDEACEEPVNFARRAGRLADEFGWL